MGFAGNRGSFAAGLCRLAPSDPARWHVDPRVAEDVDLKRGVKRSIAAGPDTMSNLDQLILGEPRSQVLAGSVDQGMITYLLRTQVFGFPDYTTVQQAGDRVNIYSRSRFGRSDIGVNKARVTRWLDALQPG